MIGDQIGTVPGWPPKERDSLPPVWPVIPMDKLPPIELPAPPGKPTEYNNFILQYTAVQDWLRKIDKILIAAKAFDEATGQPDCEIADKMEKLKELSEAFEVKMDFFKT